MIRPLAPCGATTGNIRARGPGEHPRHQSLIDLDAAHLHGMDEFAIDRHAAFHRHHDAGNSLAAVMCGDLNRTGDGIDDNLLALDKVA